MKLIIRLSFATVYFLKNNNENIYLQKNAQKTSLWEAIHTPTRIKKKKKEKLNINKLVKLFSVFWKNN